MEDFDNDAGLQSRDPDDAPAVMARAVGVAIRKAIPEAFREARREKGQVSTAQEVPTVRTEGAAPGHEDMLGQAQQVTGHGAAAGIPGMGFVSRILGQIQSMIKMVEAFKKLMDMWEKFNAPEVEKVPEFLPALQRVASQTKLSHPPATDPFQRKTVLQPLGPEELKRPPAPETQLHAPPWGAPDEKLRTPAPAPLIRPPGKETRVDSTRFPKTMLRQPRETKLAPPPDPATRLRKTEVVIPPRPKTEVAPQPPTHFEPPLPESTTAPPRVDFGKNRRRVKEEPPGEDFSIFPPPRPGVPAAHKSWSEPPRPQLRPGHQLYMPGEAPPAAALAQPVGFGGGGDMGMSSMRQAVGPLLDMIKELVAELRRGTGGKEGKMLPHQPTAAPVGGSPIQAPSQAGGMNEGDARKEAMLNASGRVLGHVLTRMAAGS